MSWMENVGDHSGAGGFGARPPSIGGGGGSRSLAPLRPLGGNLPTLGGGGGGGKLAPLGGGKLGPLGGGLPKKKLAAMPAEQVQRGDGLPKQKIAQLPSADGGGSSRSNATAFGDLEARDSAGGGRSESSSAGNRSAPAPRAAMPKAVVSAPMSQWQEPQSQPEPAPMWQEPVARGGGEPSRFDQHDRPAPRSSSGWDSSGGAAQTGFERAQGPPSHAPTVDQESGNLQGSQTGFLAQQQQAGAIQHFGKADDPFAHVHQNRAGAGRGTVGVGATPDTFGRHTKEKQIKGSVHPMMQQQGQGQQGGRFMPPPTDVDVADNRKWLTNQIVRCPCSMLLLMLLGPFIAAVLSVTHMTLEIDITTESFEIRQSHFSQQRLMADREAMRIENEHYIMRRRQLWTPAKQRLARLQIIYEPEEVRLDWIAPGTNHLGMKSHEMLDQKRLERIRDIEQRFRRFEDFTKWCKKDKHLFVACVPPNSLMTYIYPRVNPDTCRVSYDGLGDKLVRPLGVSLESIQSLDNPDWFFSQGHTTGSSTLLRSEFEFALDHDPSDQEKDEFRTWMRRIQKPMLEMQGDGVNIYFGGDMMTELQMLDQLYRDMTFAGVSFLLVLIYTAVHTESLVLAVMSMLMIALSFPVALFFYYMLNVGGNAKLGILNALSIYIITGIGVDDCYVFLDAFKQCRVGVPDYKTNEDAQQRVLGTALGRAARAMFVTSFTTALAFLANMISSIPVIYSFAVYMGLLIVIVYSFTITIFVGIVAVWARYIETFERAIFASIKASLHEFCGKTGCGQRCSKDFKAPELTPAAHEVEDGDDQPHVEPQIESFNDIVSISSDGKRTLDATKVGPRRLKRNTDHFQILSALRGAGILEPGNDEKGHKNLRYTEQFFLCRFGPWVANQRKRILSFFGVMVMVSIILASSLKASNETPQLFAEDNPIQIFMDYQALNFTGTNCDECAAAYKADFMCHNVQCGPGNRCQYGDCYDSNGNRLDEDDMLCTIDDNQLETHCSAAWAEGLHSSSNSLVRFEVAKDVTKAVLEVWEPESAFVVSGCVDNYKECHIWEIRNECGDNPSFMNYYCRFSCGLCLRTVESHWECQDNIDNDGDGLMDCVDSDCSRHPRCAASTHVQEQVLHPMCRSANCMRYIDQAVVGCQNAVQRAGVKQTLHGFCDAIWQAEISGPIPYLLPPPPPPPPTPTTCAYIEGYDNWAADATFSNATATCQCGEYETKMYGTLGGFLLMAAAALGYAAYNNGKRKPKDDFMKYINLFSSCLFYLFSCPCLAFCLACMNGGNTKEKGFFIVMDCVMFIGVGYLAVMRMFMVSKFDDDPPGKPTTRGGIIRGRMTPNKQIGNVCFVANALFLLFAVSLCIWGSVVNFFGDADTHLLARCEDDGGELADTLESMNNDVTGKHAKIANNCIKRETCDAGESMALGLVAVPTMLVSAVVLLVVRCCEDSDRRHPNREPVLPASISTVTVSVFLVHGLIGMIFWFMCVSSDTSQEAVYFWIEMLWSVIAMLVLLGWGVHKNCFGGFGLPSMMFIDFLAMVFSSVGLHTTTTLQNPFLAGCVLHQDIMAENDKVAELSGVVTDEGSQIYGVDVAKCIPDDTCGAMEGSLYGALGLLLLLVLCQAQCLRICKIVKWLPHSLNTVSILLLAGLDFTFLVFWTVCKTADTSVEKPFYVFVLIYCMGAAATLGWWSYREEFLDWGFWLMTIFFGLGCTGCIYGIVQALGNQNPVLASCAVPSPCHWYKVGMPASVDCDVYWETLRGECSTTRCNAAGICVGFQETGGCLCLPSHEGRFCDVAKATDVNKAGVAIVFGLQGLVGELDDFDDDRTALIKGMSGSDMTSDTNTAGTTSAETVAAWSPSVFLINEPTAQAHIAKVCDELMTFSEIIQTQSLMCFMLDFRDWINKRSTYNFPVEANSFLPLLKDWLATEGGKYFMHIGFHRDSVNEVTAIAWARITFYTRLSNHATGFAALPTFNALENFVATQNEQAPHTLILAPAMQTSALWIKMFTEVSAINGVVYAIVIIAFCAFVAIYVFTGHVRMATLVVANVFAMLSTILGYFKIAGWSLGIVEAISALVLIGSSVDYSLHVAESFVDCSTANHNSNRNLGRAALVTQSLTVIGVSVFHAAATTILSVVCLLFCGVVLFVQFGQIIALATAVSILFALMPLPALLGLAGPRKLHRTFKKQVFLFFIMVVIGMMIFMIMYSLDRAGHIELVGPAGEPLFGRKERVDNGALDL